MSGGIILIEPERKPDILDVRMLVASAVDGFCEHFSVAGIESRKSLLREIERQAREMREEM